MSDCGSESPSSPVADLDQLLSDHSDSEISISAHSDVVDIDVQPDISCVINEDVEHELSPLPINPSINVSFEGGDNTAERTISSKRRSGLNGFRLFYKHIRSEQTGQGKVSVAVFSKVIRISDLFRWTSTDLIIFMFFVIFCS